VSDEPTPPGADDLGERADALVVRAAGLARWATRTSAELARRLPGAPAVESELGRLERSLLTELRRRLDTVDPLDDGRADVPVEKPARDAPPPRQTEPLRVVMAELLGRSLEQTKQRAREYLYLALLRQLVPDEARILAALADGSVYPVIHVDCRTGVSGSRRVLSHASTVGRAAGVAVPASVPRYLSRLLHFDLVEPGDEDPALAVQYDILLTDAALREAEEAARLGGRPRFVRRTVRISPLGRDLWDACHPREDAEPDGAGPAAVRYAWEEVLATDPAPPADVPGRTPPTAEPAAHHGASAPPAEGHAQVDRWTTT
jgi:hypothetical protein